MAADSTIPFEKVYSAPSSADPETLRTPFEPGVVIPLEAGYLPSSPVNPPFPFEKVYSAPSSADPEDRTGSLGINIQVTGVEPLAKSFETLSARAHKQLIPAVLAGSVNRLNHAIVENIPVGPRGNRGDTGGWKRAQSRMRESDVPTAGQHTTTVAAALPSRHELGIQSDESYYPFDVEYGSRIRAAFAPIRRAVNAFEESVFGEIMDLMGAGLGILAIPVGIGLLGRKAIYGRTTPKDLMPIDYSRARPGDSL